MADGVESSDTPLLPPIGAKWHHPRVCSFTLSFNGVNYRDHTLAAATREKQRETVRQQLETQRKERAVRRVAEREARVAQLLEDAEKRRKRVEDRQRRRQMRREQSDDGAFPLLGEADEGDGDQVAELLDEEEEMTRYLAAVEIQRMARGKIARNRVRARVMVRRAALIPRRERVV